MSKAYLKIFGITLQTSCAFYMYTKKGMLTSEQIHMILEIFWQISSKEISIKKKVWKKKLKNFYFLITNLKYLKIFHDHRLNVGNRNWRSELIRSLNKLTYVRVSCARIARMPIIKYVQINIFYVFGDSCAMS